MMGASQLEQQIIERLAQAGILSTLDRDASQVLNLGNEVWAEIVLTDASKTAEAEALIRPLLPKPDSLVIRSRWKISEIGEPVAARAPDGGLRAAVLVPIRLNSGAESTTVTVSITKAAEWELEQILGGKVPFKELAKVFVESSLQRGGESAWNPAAQSYLEIASGGVGNISRLLRQAA